MRTRICVVLSTVPYQNPPPNKGAIEAFELEGTLKSHLGCLKNKLYNTARNLRVQIQTQLQISAVIKSVACFLSFTIIIMTYEVRIWFQIF